MLGRVNPALMKNDFLYNVQASKERFQGLQTQLTSGNRINLPSEGPANVISYMEWQNKHQDINKFNTVIDNYKGKLNIVDANLDAVTASLQRARELIVQSANGIMKQEDRVLVAMEMDQLIRQLVSDANCQYNGNPLFSGTSTMQQPYRITENHHEDCVSPFVTKVDYFGNAQEQVIDIGRFDRVSTIAAGVNIFQTTTTILQGNKDVAGYVAPQDSRIALEGVSIMISHGDNLEVISQKINDAQSSCKASIETTQDGVAYFRLTSISARQQWVQDLAGGSVFQDLGLINEASEGPRNYSTEAIVRKNSLFDTLVSIKDHLLENNVKELGGSDLGYIDQSMENIMRHRAYTGALIERLETTFDRNTHEALYLKDSASHMINTDYIASITELKMAEFAHQTALNIGAKLLPTTLMDFLR